MAAMTNTRKILIVDDDAELRDAMVEQLALHEEFESVAVDSGSKGVQAAKSGQVDLVIIRVSGEALPWRGSFWPALVRD
jgi:DNA-binding response OmpR family regulator